MRRCAYFVSVLVLLISQLAHPRDQDWKHYKNQRWGFCVAYPRGWLHNEGINKAGISVYPEQDGPGANWSDISVGALLVSRAADGHLPTVQENFAGVDKTRREMGATDLVVIDEHETAIDNHSAVFRKVTYKDSAGLIWMDETIAFQTPDGLGYALELKSHPLDVAKLEPIFNAVIRTFRIDCVRRGKRSD